MKSETKFDVIVTGVVYLSVCTDAVGREEIERLANFERPTGVGPWRLSENKHFTTGHTNPCVCERDPARQHWLLSC